MRKLLHTCIIILVLFSIISETFVYIYTDLDIPNYPVEKLSRLIYYYSYFTVLSNICIGVISILLLINPNRNSLGFCVLRLDGLVCIIITSVVYNIVLRKSYSHDGFIISLTNELLHVVIPFLGILVWLLYGPRPRINRKTMFLAIIPPFLYTVYIFIRGEITHLYPYPFMDAGKIGFQQAVLNTSVILVIFLSLELILYLMDVKLSRKISSF